MIGFLSKKQIKTRTELRARSFDAMAVMILLAQLPHVFHLPIWISVFGAGVVAIKWWNVHHPNNLKLNWVLSSRAAVVLGLLGGVLIKLHFGYFIGRDPCVAFLFLLLGCKFAEARRQSDATTLMCLSGFLLLTQYLYSQSILSALLTIPAVMSLGVALSILNEHSTRSLSNHARLVGRLLIQGAPIAALLFIVFPRLPGPLWSLPEDATATTGLSDSMSPGEIGNLSQSDEVAFRVDFEGTPPDARDLYWRGPVMSNFDGSNWSINKLQADGAIETSNTTADLGNDNSKSISYTVTLQPHNKKWLFALEQASSLPSTGESNAGKFSLNPEIRADKQILSNKPITNIVQYKQSSLMLDRYTPSTRPSAIDLILTGKNSRTAAFADKLFSKHETPMAFAMAVLSWFNTQPYSYTLQPTLLGDSPIDEFMFDTQNGFCGHYASAFVVMMRAVGIPARIVTGYQGGEMNDDYMIVRQSEAHAWAEVFIDGQWIRFDPTAAVAPSRVDYGLAASLPEGEPVPRLARAGNGWIKRASLRWDRVNHGWQRMVVDFNNESQSKFWKKLGTPNPQLWQITIALLALAAAWCMWVLRPSRSAMAPVTEDQKFWRAYSQYLDKLGVSRLPAETGAQLTKRASIELSEHSELIARIGLAFIKIKFEPISNKRKSAIRVQLKRDLKKLASIARRAKTQQIALQTLQGKSSATS